MRRVALAVGRDRADFVEARVTVVLRLAVQRDREARLGPVVLLARLAERAPELPTAIRKIKNCRTN